MPRRRSNLPYEHNTGNYSMFINIISHHITGLKWQTQLLKVGTDKPKLKVKMQTVSDDDVQKRFLENPHFELL